jgi:hypothetical protein
MTAVLPNRTFSGQGDYIKLMFALQGQKNEAHMDGASLCNAGEKQSGC